MVTNTVISASGTSLLYKYNLSLLIKKSSPFVSILNGIIWKPSSCSVLKEKRPLEGEFCPFLSMNYSIKLGLFFVVGL